MVANSSTYETDLGFCTIPNKVPWLPTVIADELPVPRIYDKGGFLGCQYLEHVEHSSSAAVVVPAWAAADGAATGEEVVVVTEEEEEEGGEHAAPGPATPAAGVAPGTSPDFARSTSDCVVEVGARVPVAKPNDRRPPWSA